MDDSHLKNTINHLENSVDRRLRQFVRVISPFHEDGIANYEFDLEQERIMDELYVDGVDMERHCPMLREMYKEQDLRISDGSYDPNNNNLVYGEV